MAVAWAAFQLASVSLLEYSTRTGVTAVALAALLAVLLVEAELPVVVVAAVDEVDGFTLVDGVQAASKVVHSTAARVEASHFLG